MSFPTKKEIRALIENGAKCPRCDINQATMTFIQGQPAVGMCEDCSAQMKSKYPVKRDNSMGGNRVHSVWQDDRGNMIPVNERGNVIHTEPKYERKKGEKPLW